MPAPAQTQTERVPQEARRGRRENARAVMLVALAIVVTLFAVLNFQSVKVDWLVGSARAPLIVVILISLFVGAVLAHFAARRAGKRQ